MIYLVSFISALKVGRHGHSGKTVQQLVVKGEGHGQGHVNRENVLDKAGKLKHVTYKLVKEVSTEKGYLNLNRPDIGSFVVFFMLWLLS